MKRKNLVLRSTGHVLKNNIALSLLLIVAVAGVVVASLAPPQILKAIIDTSLLPKKTDGLLSLALAYPCGGSLHRRLRLPERGDPDGARATAHERNSR